MNEQQYVDKWLSKKEQDSLWEQECNLFDGNNNYNSKLDFLILEARDREFDTLVQTIKDKYLDGEIKKEKRNQKDIHFSEYKKDYQRILFYKIFEDNGIKYIAFELSSYTLPSWNNFKILDYNDCFTNVSREQYCEKLAEKKLGFQIPLNNRVELKEFCKFDLSYGVSKFKIQHIYYIDAEKLFYNNDLLLYDNGKGRQYKELDEITQHTPLGEYYSKETIIVDKNDNRWTLADYIKTMNE